MTIYLFPFLFTDNRQASHALSNVFSQLVLGKSMKPDFNAEETASVQKDKREIQKIVQEMAEYLPQEDPEKGTNRKLKSIISLLRIFSKK